MNSLWGTEKSKKKMKVEDISEFIDYGKVCVQETLVEGFKTKHCILTSLEDLVKERLKEKDKVKPK